jgi:hypothetical protein
LVGLLLVATVYFLPSLLAWRRAHPWRQKILLANAATGWTLLGWIICMVLSLRQPRR